MKSLFSISLIFLVFSCSKEKMIEHHLNRKDGIWYVNKIVDLELKNGYQTDMSVGMNMGFFQFQKSGTGTLTLSGNIESFNWSNTKDKLTLESDGTMREMDIVEESKKFMKLNYIEIDTVGVNVYTQDITFELEKK